MPRARSLAHLAELGVSRRDVLRGRNIFLLLIAVDDSLIVTVVVGC
jgi:hypothetical protein